MKGNLNAFLRDEEAISIVEYAIAAGLFTVAIASALIAFGGSTNAVFTTITVFLTS